jgi:hypothetical protein
MKRISVVVGLLLTAAGCSIQRGSMPFRTEGDTIPPVLPNFSREVQSSDQTDTLRVEGFVQTTAEVRR